MKLNKNKNRLVVFKRYFNKISIPYEDMEYLLKVEFLNKFKILDFD
jgi:hypothetical protein